jgi:hypothetical protein
MLLLGERGRYRSSREAPVPGGDEMHPMVAEVVERQRAVDKATRGVPDRIRAILARTGNGRILRE